MPHLPGWNDPPALLGVSTQSRTPGQRLLTKRVPFLSHVSPVVPGTVSDNNRSSPVINHEQLRPPILTALPTSTDASSSDSLLTAGSLPIPVEEAPAGSGCASVPQSQENHGFALFTGATQHSPSAAQAATSAAIESASETLNAAPMTDLAHTRTPKSSADVDNVMQILDAAMSGCLLSDGVRSGINRRLPKLVESLQHNLLSDDCVLKLRLLLDAMVIANWNEAYRIHTNMVVAHFTEVSSWIAAVKSILLERLKA
jgi:hypothetical protein